MKEIKIGWNLGNTFDAHDGETSWGNPKVTVELLKTVKDLGFNTIRMPISWGKHVSAAPEYIVDGAFMERVHTVVCQALELGLHVIINVHHDNHIYMPRPDNCEAAKEYLRAVWKQIGERFEDCDYRLIFQTMNEPRIVGTDYEWDIDLKNEDCMASVAVVNELNQAALDAIRATGGKNADRYVMICPYAGKPASAMNDIFRMPVDSVENRLILSIHAYTPYNLCLNITSPIADFTEADLAEIESFIPKLYDSFVSKGIPVIIDEMGCTDKKNPQARYAWAKSYIAAATKYGIPCIWWDNGYLNCDEENFAMIDRLTNTVHADSATAYQGLMDGLSVK